MAKFAVTGYSQETGTELYIYNSLNASMSLLRDINPGSNGTFDSLPARFTRFNGGYIFTASDGQTGSELWYTDATSAGTRLVSDLAPGLRSANPEGATVVGSLAYFTATNLVRVVGTLDDGALRTGVDE